ncbi:MAG: threonine dehydratase, partial [Pseudomonadota bacterium]
GLAATVVVPFANSLEKNAALRALGATLVEHGEDFQAALEHARTIAGQCQLAFADSFADGLVRGVASYGLEFFRAVDALERVYVPIGLGSGICGAIAARDALGLGTEIVGVVAERAPAYALSFAAGRAVATATADTLADGLAVRVPSEAALAMIGEGATRIVTVSESEIRAAIRHYFTDTHNLAEGAGAAPLAAALAEKDRNAGRRIGLVLSGGNIDRPLFAAILADRQSAPEKGTP